jgi:hypothetical protein
MNKFLVEATMAINDYLRKNKAIIIYSIVMAVICYGYELFNFSLSIDEEGYLFQKAINDMHWIELGRWGTYLINLLLFPYSLIPFLPTLISIACISSASVLFVNSEKGDLQSKIIFSLLFISYPLHSYYIAFSTLSASLGIGIVFSVIGFLIVKACFNRQRQRFAYLVSAVIVLSLSMSTYQGIFPVYILFVLTHLFVHIINEPKTTIKELLSKLFLFLSVFCAAFVVYYIVDYGFKYFLLDPSYKTNPQYFDHFIGWGNLPFKQVLLNLFSYTKGYLWGDSFYGMASIRTIFLFIPFIVFVVFKKVKLFQLRVVSISMLIIMLVTPFLVMYLIGSKLPPRSLEALPFLMAIIWWLVSQHVRSGIRSAIVVASILLFVGNTYHTTRLFHTSYVTWQADRVMAGRIIERIYQLDYPQKKGKIPIAFVGSFRYEENELFMKTRDVFGASYFEWNKAQGCIRNLYKSMGINEIMLVPKQNLSQYSEIINEMESWPHKNSIRVKDDIVFVKLRDAKVNF